MTAPHVRIQLAGTGKMVWMDEMDEKDWNEFNLMGAISEDGMDVIHHRFTQSIHKRNRTDSIKPSMPPHKETPQ